MSLVSLLGAFGTAFISLWAAFKYVLLGSYRLNNDTSKRLIDKIESEANWTWILTGECVLKPKYPNVLELFTILGGIPFYFSRNERLMTAGWQGKEDLSQITFFRWQRNAIDKLLRQDILSCAIPISALSAASNDRLGDLEPNPNATVYLNSGSYEDIEEDVQKVLKGNLSKTSCLLYGPPGNGKTQFVKYLSRKYSLPIFVVYLNPDYDNFSIARMFSEIPRRCIVLLEDFDNYFNGRVCIMKNEQVRFTFDSLLSALDGVHNDYREVVFVMTANDIEKIDDSIKNRPSRFKFVRMFKEPDYDIRKRILVNEDAARVTEGLSLDEVFSLATQNCVKDI